MHKNIEIKKTLITIKLPREVELNPVVPFFNSKINCILKHGVFLRAMQNEHALCVCSKDMLKAVVLRTTCIYMNRIKQLTQCLLLSRYKDLSSSILILVEKNNNESTSIQNNNVK